jgi:hypothetical protein
MILKQFDKFLESLETILRNHKVSRGILSGNSDWWALRVDRSILNVLDAIGKLDFVVLLEGTIKVFDFARSFISD